MGISSMFFGEMEFIEGGGGALQAEYEKILAQYEGQENGQSVKQYWAALMNNPSIEATWNESLSSAGMILKQMQKEVSFWNNADYTKLMECVAPETADADVQEALDFFFPQDTDWNPFFEIIFRFDDNLAK